MNLSHEVAEAKASAIALRDAAAACGPAQAALQARLLVAAANLSTMTELAVRGIDRIEQLELAANATGDRPTDETGEPKSISERVEAVRVGLFDSMAMVDVASRAVSPDKDWHLRHTLEVVGRQIDTACTVLEEIAIDARVQEVQS